MDELGGHVTIVGLQAVVVADDDVFAVATGLVFHDTYLATEGSADGVTNVYLDVETLVLASPTGTEVRGDDTAVGRHAETAQVDGGLIGEGNTRVMGELIVPLVVEVACRVFEHFLFNQFVEYYGIDSFHFPVNRSLTCQEILSLRRDGSE